MLDYINHYGDLYTHMCEFYTRSVARWLDFYLSYAKKTHKILEPLYGNGVFNPLFSKKIQ
ncbi:hypothetical protein CCZ01_05330 [Helicobacter monodelphidis]|uniref:SAM-dependent methyltransferase n=1 Tax=Helicobacter sp. 15-1451 TaxID=2004995 RepID=UPI000DCEFD8C|nr:SAM-dependent methyltransferase [Helicobacter sp. 15-1451]RAX57708.1 hypothetical protein CCZ01_05330 [Helicobacter sp. 15-1451]